MRLLVLLISWCFASQAWASSPVRIERYAPDAMTSLFVSKGTKMGGFSIAYREESISNINITVLKNFDGDGYNFGVSPHFGYFFKDNQAVGVRFNYSRTKIDLRKLDLSLGEDFNISLDNIYYIANAYDLSGYWRVYLPIAKSKIFAVFNETRLGYSYEESKNSTGSGVDYEGSFTTSNHLFVGAAPGITAFITNNAAIEASVGLVGLDFGWTNQTTSQVEDGSRNSAAARFKLNLLSLNLGMVVYF